MGAGGYALAFAGRGWGGRRRQTGAEVWERRVGGCSLLYPPRTQKPTPRLLGSASPFSRLASYCRAAPPSFPPLLFLTTPLQSFWPSYQVGFLIHAN